MHEMTTTDALKAQAKRLRAALAKSGTAVSHSQSLELVAQSIGARDWNTVAAQTASPRPILQVGQSVRGRYLGHAFTGRIHAVSARNGGWHRITVDFDSPVDVVQSEHFSALRRRVSAVIDPSGVTVEKTSDGQPHLQLA